MDLGGDGLRLRGRWLRWLRWLAWERWSESSSSYSSKSLEYSDPCDAVRPGVYGDLTPSESSPGDVAAPPPPPWCLPPRGVRFRPDRERPLEELPRPVLFVLGGCDPGPPAVVRVPAVSDAHAHAAARLICKSRCRIPRATIHKPPPKV